jgi:hypothetical protein
MIGCGLILHLEDLARLERAVEIDPPPSDRGREAEGRQRQTCYHCDYHPEPNPHARPHRRDAAC